MIKKTILIFWLIFYGHLLFSTNNNRFKIYCDKNQNIWIAQKNAINKFDGKKITTIYFTDTNSNSENNQIINFWENNNAVYFFTKDNKLLCYKSDTLKKINISKDEINKLKQQQQAVKISLNNIDLYFLNKNVKKIQYKPFYQKIWFYILNVIIITIIFYLLYRLRIKTIKRQQEIKKNLETYQYQALNKQMNPHFIFNSLNSIQNYILQNDIKNSNKYLTKFSQLMRMVLNNTQSHIITINKEIEALVLYLELEQIRFKNRFEYKINIEKNLDIYTYKIPPLLLQPFVENAIWHGLMNMPDGHRGEIIINVKHKNEFIIFEIIDNGIGRNKADEINKQKTTNSLGTKINKSRADLFNEIFDLKIQIKYVDLLDSQGNSKGTRVVIKLNSSIIK